MAKVPGVKVAQLYSDIDPALMPQSPEDALGFGEPSFTVNAIPRAGLSVPSEPVPLDIAPPVQPNGLPTSLVDGAQGPKSYQQQILDMVNSPEIKAQRAALADASKKSIEEQRQGLKENENSLQHIEANGPQLNMMPLMSLTDAWTGSKFADHYQQPDTPEQRQMKLMTIKDQLQKQRQGITTEQLQLLKDQLSQTDYKNLLAQLGMGARLDQRDRQLGMREDQITAQAVKDIDNHPIVQTATKQLGQIDIDSHTVQTAKKITPQMLHEISNGIAAALAGGNSVGLGLAQMQDLATSKTKMADWEQYLTDHPKNGASPAVKRQIIDVLSRLKEAYGQYRSSVVNKLLEGRTFENTPQAQRALQSVREKYAYTPPPKAPKALAPINKKAPTKLAPGFDANLDSMSPEELQNWIDTHGN